VDWLDRSELRVGLGCMRLPDDDSAIATIEAAHDAGITVFDTARAYDGNERLLARALHGRIARIVTKGGMSHVGGRWIPDGRAKTIRSDCEASVAALDGLPVELYLVHAPDPRTPWRTTVRALARLLDDGVVHRVGVSNVNRRQLDEALELAPISALEVGLSVFDDSALRGGLVDRCVELGVALIAHSPLGGPRRARALARDETLAGIGAARAVTPAQLALSWLLALAPVVVPIPGARRPEDARAAAEASALDVSAQEREAVERRFGVLRAAPRASPRAKGEVVLIMGIPGSGKSRVAAGYVERGYVRLNRDERGGSLRDLAVALEDELAAGARRVVIDNTYLTRAARSRPLEIAARFRLPVRCVWLETPLAQAQVNMVTRILERVGELPQPEELARLARTEEGLLTPTSQMRSIRQLEPPEADEGFVSLEHVEFRRVRAATSRSGVFIAASAVERAPLRDIDPAAPHLVFDWRPGKGDGSLASAVEQVARRVDGPVEAATCPHGGGPPVCWCRPPLPGLPLVFARAHGLDPAASTLVGHSATHRALAQTLGARFIENEAS
jgi:aryl-alcohol dehydrogenase-like predicted oxidoreductase/predicted kinase